MKQLFKKLRRNEDGATAVETALVLPFIAVFLFGTFKISLIFYDLAKTQYSLETAARNILILSNPTESEVLAAANAAIYQPSSASVVLSTTFVNQYGADYARLNATYSYAVSIPFTNGVTLNKTLGTEIVLQR